MLTHASITLIEKSGKISSISLPYVEYKKYTEHMLLTHYNDIQKIKSLILDICSTYQLNIVPSVLSLWGLYDLNNFLEKFEHNYLFSEFSNTWKIRCNNIN